MLTNGGDSRSQVGIGTLAVFIAMVLVALLAGGVLLETTGLLQGDSAVAGQDSADRVTDRVGVDSATAAYSSGSMQRIDIVLSKAPGSGDIDLSELTVHWLGPNGSTELTDSTFSITPVKGSGTVLESRSDRLNVSNFGKTIPDGTPATVRFITADGGTTTVILRPPDAPPSDGDVSLLWRSPSGNPATGGGTATATATATATPTPTPTPGPSLDLEWSTSPIDGVDDLAADSGTSVYVVSAVTEGAEIREIDESNGSVLDSSPSTDWNDSLSIDQNDDPVWDVGEIRRWDRQSNTIETVVSPSIQIEDLEPYSGDFYVASDTDQNLSRYNSDGSIDWSGYAQPIRAVDTTSSGLYAPYGKYVRHWDHSGTIQWTSTETANENYDLAAGHSTYVFVVDGAAEISRLYKSNGTESDIYTADNSDADLEVGPDDNLYVADGQDLHVLDADGSEILTKNFGSSVDDVESRSDGIYVDVGSSVKKYTKSGF